MGGVGPAGRAAGGAALGALLGLAVACGTPSGTLHSVRPGENLYRIARFYGVDVGDVVRANRIRDVHSLSVGRQIVIPGSAKGQPRRALTPGAGGPAAKKKKAAARRPPDRSGDRAAALREADLRFAWPVRGAINSRFGWRGSRRHEGIDIKARKGTPIQAAEAGRVIYSGRLSDYGRVVILKHAGRYSSVYAHNHRNRVNKGDFVEKGQTIAEVGKTGNASGSHLHFEVRRDRVAQDPLRYLPKDARTARR